MMFSLFILFIIIVLCFAIVYAHLGLVYLKKRQYKQNKWYINFLIRVFHDMINCKDVRIDEFYDENEN